MAGQVFGFEHGAAHRWAELANRLFGMESADAPLPPGFILELDRPEWKWLKRERLWTTGALAVAASVGNVSRIQVINPANSGFVVVVTGARLVNIAVAGTRAQLTLDGARIGAGLVNNLALDTRAPLQAGIRKVFSQNAIDNSLPNSSGTSIDEKSAGTANSDITFDELTSVLPVILVPNTNLDLVLVLVNTAIRGVIWGYERPVTPDELAP